MMNSYTLDPHNQILAVGDSWDRFASENGGAAVLARNVIGRNLAQFVAGVETAGVLNAVFHLTRRHKTPVTFPYRCDSPTAPRLFQMVVRPGPGSTLCVEHWLMYTPARSNLSATNGRARHSPRCSMCNRYEAQDGGWVDAFADPGCRYAARSHALCDDCRSRMQAAVRAAAMLGNRPRLQA